MTIFIKIAPKSEEIMPAVRPGVIRALVQNITALITKVKIPTVNIFMGNVMATKNGLTFALKNINTKEAVTNEE